MTSPYLLDDPAALTAGDPGGMLLAIATSAAQVREAARLALEAGVASLAEDGRPRSVVVAGMGGSGIAGDALAAVTGAACPLPVQTWRDFGLPAWVGAADLVVAVTCSGTTEETLSALQEAVRRGCRLLVVSAAGSPAEALGRQGRAIVVPVRQGMQPRASLWALCTPLVVAADALGLVRAPAGVVEETAVALEGAAQQCRPDADEVVNPAKALAAWLSGSLPVVWGSSPLTGVVAQRFACQLNENAAVPAVPGVLPEAGHNQVVTLDGPFGRRSEQDLFADPLDEGGPGAAVTRERLVLLRDSEEHPGSTSRAQAVQELAEDRSVPVTVLTATGASSFERLASLVAVTDFASAYLALLEGRDPTPVEVITQLKARTRR